MANAMENESVHASWGWLALLGAISLIGGILALANPFAATMTAAILAAWTFVLFGAVQIVQAFRVRGWGGFLWALLLGVLTLAVGVSIIARPGAGIISLTILVAVMFLVLGAVKVMYSFSFRPLSGWGWVLFSGVVSLILGVMILADMPWSAATILGILLAIELLSNGVFLLFIAFGLRGAMRA
ncbi:HdeD family acid-resistance protein [Nitratireductor kimnyeongensis]|uniref:HdeD family acid-resistance protein n=1 Tax=Nitratireductor kimnyeongensis TaxID=430679 RepID=A0ABW0TB54_9HYPH|nr:HdeD family acid-resistance protein [Nitratireductor kimnyeongensis]QZZ35458.1 HdeD family acid-resistance protein [Nitratireductor kimnyeongensis]